MRLLFTSDWQTSLSNLPESEQALGKLLKVIRKHKVQSVFDLGDFKHVLNPVDQRVTNFLVHKAERITAACEQYVCLLGNHDRTTMQDESQSCLPVLRAAGAWTVDYPSRIRVGSASVQLVPWIRDKAVLLDAFKAAPPADFLLFHCELDGAKMNVSSPRVDSRITPKSIRCRRYKMCFGGHIHYHQKVARNVWYVGSPFCQDWGEANQQKVFVLVDYSEPDKWSVAAIPTGMPGWYDPSLPNFNAPKKWIGCRVRIQYDGEIEPGSAEEVKLRSKLSEKYSGALDISLRCSGAPTSNPEEEIKRFDGDRQVVEWFLKERGVTAGTEKQAAEFILSRLPEVHHGFGLVPIKLVRAAAKNVLCFPEASLDLDRKGLTLVTGRNMDWKGRSNGAGKTTLLGIPMVAFAGESPKGQSKDQWRTRNCSDSSQTSLLFEVAGPKSVLITRSRNPSALELRVDGRDCTMGSANDTQKQIESLTGITKEVLLNSLYISQTETATVLHGTDKQRKELFARFLGLARFEKASEHIRKDIRIAKQAEESASTRQTVAEDREESIKNLLDSLPTKKACALAVRKDFKIRKLLKATAATAKELEESHSALERKQEDVQAQIDTVSPKYYGAASAESGLVEAIRDLDSDLSCPTCNRPFPNRKSNKAAHNKLGKRLNAVRAELTEYQPILERLESVKSKTRLALERCAKKYKAVRDRLYNLRVERERIQQKVERAKQAHSTRIKLRTAKRCTELHRRCVELLQAEQRFLESCLSAVGRDGIPAYLCALVCPQLNAAAVRFSEEFTDGAIQVRFSIDQGDLDVEVTNEHGGETFRDQSMGESRLASLIAVLAFREILVPSNVLILDEPGEGLDSHNSMLLAKAIRKLTSRFGSVFVTSHNPHIVENLEPDYHLEVVKENRMAIVREL